jgi:hypothetical protein
VADGLVVAGGEVDGVGRVEVVPGERVVAARDDPVADDGDGALAVCVEVGEAAPVGTVAPGGVDGDAVAFEVGSDGGGAVVAAEGREEGGCARELSELHRGDGAPAGRLGVVVRGVGDLARRRQAVDDAELDVLDVADDRDPRGHAVWGRTSAAPLWRSQLRCSR